MLSGGFPEGEAEERVKQLRKWVLLGVLIGGLSVSMVLPTNVAAQDDSDATTYDFEDDLVSGDLVRPDGELLNVRPSRSSFIFDSHSGTFHSRDAQIG